MYIRTYLQTVTCVCVCICVWAGRSDAAGWTTNRTGPDSVFLFLSLYYLHTKITKIVCRHALRRRDAFKASARRSLYVSSVQLWVYSNRGGSLEHVFSSAKHRRSTFYIYSTKQASERTMGVYVYVYIVTVLNRFCRLSAPYEDIPITLSKGSYTLTLIRNRYRKD